MTASSASTSAPSPVPLAIARSMLSLGIEASLAFCTASASAGLPSTSPPPSFAATVIARASFVKSLPRRASTIAFLCLIPAHLECPAMPTSLLPGRDGPGTTDPADPFPPLRRVAGARGHQRVLRPRRLPVRRHPAGGARLVPLRHPRRRGGTD